jgi:ferric-dicitrate binding protein FerR (iron transport regulator)
MARVPAAHRALNSLIVGKHEANAYGGLMEDQARDAAIEELLRASRPSPDPEFVGSLERRLFPGNTHARRPARRPLLVGAAATAAMACAVLVAGLVGAGPLALDGQDSSTANENCRFVTVQRQERVPVVVTSGKGVQKLEFRLRPVERRVKRCS